MKPGVRYEPRVTLVAALARNRVIGRDNVLPWRLPGDLKRFKALTWGKPVLMGRRTYESIARALPGRRNIIVSRQPDYRAQGCEVHASIEAALDACTAAEVMVIGGAQIYASSLALSSRMHLTFIDAEVEGDAHFPQFDPRAWRETSRVRVAGEEGATWSYSFVDLERGE